jgi:hypothetical protein
MMKHSTKNQKQTKTVQGNKNKGQSWYSWYILAGLIAFVVFVRIRLFSTPFERDEGEYAYIGQLFLQGIAPFKAAFTMKLPGTSFLYAVFMLLFGQTVTAIHLGLLIINSVSIILIFLLTRRWFSTYAGIISAGSFALSSLSPAVFGFAAHATHFVMCFSLAGLLMLDIALEKKTQTLFFFSGFSFGCAFLMKQPGLFFFFLSISILIFHKISHKIEWKKISRFAIILTGGFVIPVLLLLLVILLGGTFDKFWFWIVQYSSQYGSLMEIKHGIPLLLSVLLTIWEDLPIVCVLACLGFILLLTKRHRTLPTVMLLLFLVFSILAVMPGFYFRPHYFVLLLPACSMLIGSVFYYVDKISKQRYAWKLSLALALIAAVFENVHGNYKYYFITSPTEIVQQYYWGNYFSESIVIGNFLASHTAPNERIAVLGSEPQMYFYSRRHSASGHIYMYGMMEPQPYARLMQDEMIADIEQNQPKYIVYIRSRFSWAAKSTSDSHIFRWTEGFTKQYYHPVCMVYPVDYFTVRYAWGNEIQQQDPNAQKVIVIYEKNNTIP